MLSDEAAINRCLQIAKNGLGTTAPNPMVGAIVVHNQKIIGEGFTSAYGGPHAEVNAIQAVNNKTLLKESTLYVTLEPCSHYGKTPPCTNLIIESQIPTVVIGCLDDNPAVAGTGVKHLRESGCTVKIGVLEKECKQHHRRFFTFFNKKRPYIILKWAQSNDGFIAPDKRKKREPVWITNPYSRQLVHKWRSEEQAILVGSKTIREDNPSLTVRDWAGTNPIRIALSKELNPFSDYKIFNGDSETICTSKSLDELMPMLFEKNITSLIVEGGTQVLQSFIEAGLWDEARVFIGVIDFKGGVVGPKFKSIAAHQCQIESDVLKYYFND